MKSLTLRIVRRGAGALGTGLLVGSLLAVSAPSQASEDTPTTGPSATVEVTSANALGLNLRINGSGYLTDPASASVCQGIYVGLAPSGGLPDVSSSANVANFAGYNAVWTDSILANQGSFTTTITVSDWSALDAERHYSVYAWCAHRHTTTSQDTETPVEIDFTAATLKLSTSARIALKAPTTTRPGRVTVKLAGTPAPTGTLRVTLFRGNRKVQALDPVLKSGTATAVLANAKPGAYRVVAKYAGSSAYSTAKESKRFRVRVDPTADA